MLRNVITVVTVRGVRMSTERSVTSKIVGAALNVSPATIQAYARNGRIPFSVTPGGHRRFDVAEVQAALEPKATTTDVRLLLRPLAERELEFGSTPPDRAHLAEAVELAGSRPELPSQSRRADAIPPENSAVHTALWQLLCGARSSRLETVGA